MYDSMYSIYNYHDITTRDLEYEDYIRREHIENCDMSYIDRFCKKKDKSHAVRKTIADMLIRLAKAVYPAYAN